MPLNPAAAAASLQPLPLNLQALLDQLTHSQSLTAIQTLAVSYLNSEHAETVINCATAFQAATAFASRFSESVFPLTLEHIVTEEEEDPHLADNLLAGIPYYLGGIETSCELHEIHNGGPPALTAGLMLTDFFGINEDTFPYAGEEIAALRAVWAEHLDETQGVSSETLQRIPPFGHQPGHIIKAVTGTPHEMAAELVNYLSQMEDNVFLSWYSEEEELNFSDPWNRENVELATALWQRAQTILTRMNTYIEQQNHRVPQMLQEILDLVEATPEPRHGEDA